jgi:hypothetical protein
MAPLPSHILFLIKGFIYSEQSFIANRRLHGRSEPRPWEGPVITNFIALCTAVETTVKAESEIHVAVLVMFG